MAEKRNLEFFMANPHELPGSLDELDATLTGDDGEGGEAGTSAGEAAATTGEESAASGAAATDTKTENAPGATQVILSKNGKHEIPYAVLESERQQRLAAESVAQTLRDQLAALQQQTTTAPAAGSPQSEAQAAADVPLIDEDTVRQIEEDNPEQGKVIRALISQVGFLAEQLGSVRQSEQARQNVETRTRSETVQEVIDANPTLRYLQAEKPDMFARAVEFDKTIRSDPTNRGLPLSERFQKVVNAMQAVYGPVDVPQGYAAEGAAPNQPAAGKGAAKGGAAQRPEVSSLSEIPGGTPPLSDEVEQLGQLSAHELGNKFMNMDPNKVLAILSRAA
jgi:hypothetical protein